MTDAGRTDYDLPVPVVTPGGVPVVVPTRLSFDDAYTGHTPTSLTDGVKTELDASSLDSAITWLESYSSYLNHTVYDMADIKELMGQVGNGSASPMGGFPWAQELAAKHSGLYSSTETAIRQLSERLQLAADALKQVKENYHSAEGANSMSAARMQQAFTDAARNQA